MSDPLAKYILKHTQTGKPVDAFLYEGITESHLEDVDLRWKP
ncbi:hypothetical protein MNBD_DELTA02-491 [hydrothermal vent metagenome]|uniref:Uncharacterized protein n=1 Tax=hydrothermal vent metagenome TaxID=652676 RepID=A0A3B0VF94_9ZZZZ